MIHSIVEAVFVHAQTHPDKLCLADDAGKVTYGEYTQRIRQFAGVFAADGIGAGDRVVVEACQTIDYLAIQLALELLDAVFVPVEHNCAPEKIGSFIVRAGARAVVTVKEGGYDADLCYTYAPLAEKCVAAVPYTVTDFPTADSISEILFSTGTTGKEKGIVLTHSNNIALAENVIHGVQMEKDNVEMIPSPMNHSHGLRRYYANMYMGATVILLGSVMNIRLFFKNLDVYNVNSIDLVPSALTLVLKLSKDKLAEYADKLRYIQFGAAPMMEADKIKICQLLPGTRLYNFYGSTESGCIAIYDFNCGSDKKSCVGKPTCNADIFIVDDDRKPIRSSRENTGLLASRGGMNMLLYWQDEEETARAMENGVVYSNDVAYFDEDGDIILLGRKGDVINIGGNKVSPEEIENAVKKMPEVFDCGVIPVKDPYKGSVPKLYVQLKEGCVFDSVAIRTFLAASLEPYKVPVYIEKLDRIPRSYNGKLLRKELTALNEKEPVSV